MGRKGVSKRKSGQTRAKPMSSGPARRHPFPATKADEPQVISSGKDSQNPVTDQKKKPRKG